jgi:HSP20 family protein
MSDTALQKNNGAQRRGAVLAERQVTFTPRADILETTEELRLLLDMPGVKPDDVEVQFERGELTVHGRCAPREKSGRLLAAEYEVGDYYRAFLIGQEVDAEKINAELKNGVLTVHLPKSASAKARRIAVQGQ